MMKRASKQSNNGPITAFAILVGSAFFSIPFFTHYMKKENLNSTEKPLNATQIRRGAYLNTGSKDVGVDVDWDFRSNTWHGRRANNNQETKPQAH